MRTAGARSAPGARLAGVLAVTVTLALATAACHGKPKHYAGTFPGQKADVSAKDAFRHYGLTLPPRVSHLGYAATSSDDTYPLVAAFSAKCADIPRFISSGKLKSLHSMWDMNDAGAGIEAVATQHGWSKTSKGNRWYERRFAEYQVIDVLTHQDAGGCRVYISA